MRSLIDFFACLIASPVWLTAFVLESRAIRSLHHRMSRCGRTIKAEDLVSQYVDRGGTLLVEIDRILLRGVWYSPVDVTEIENVEMPTNLQRGPGEVKELIPFDHWCHERLTNETSGTALFVIGRSKELDELIRTHAIHIPHLKPGV